MFIETSSPRHSGDKARLIGPSISGSGQPVCFTFWYNMFGDHVAALNIYVKKGSSLGTPVWTRSGAQGSAWKQAQVQFTPTSAVMVRTIIHAWVKVFRIIPEFRILLLTFHRKSASKC